MGDIVETMLRQTMTALLTDDRKLVAEIARMDDAVDKLHEAIKLYVTEITRESLDERERPPRHGDHLLLHQSRAYRRHHRQEPDGAGAARRSSASLQFSTEGAAELEAFHQARHATTQARLRRLHVRRRRRSRASSRARRRRSATAELAAAESHLARLREGRPESIETSSLHLDILRDLKRIHSHICSVAYPGARSGRRIACTGDRSGRNCYGGQNFTMKRAPTRQRRLSPKGAS